MPLLMNTFIAYRLILFFFSLFSGMLYVCVLCKYMNGKRRNLYQHLKKKHKISIMIKKDGTTSCVVEPNADVTVVASSEGKKLTENIVFFMFILQNSWCIVSESPAHDPFIYPDLLQSH